VKKKQKTGTVLSTSGAKAAKARKISVKKLQKEHEKEMNKKAGEAGNAGDAENAGSCLWLCSLAQSLRALCTVVVRNQVWCGISLLALLVQQYKY
jgi:hypothetical protein